MLGGVGKVAPGARLATPCTAAARPGQRYLGLGMWSYALRRGSDRGRRVVGSAVAPVSKTAEPNGERSVPQGSGRTVLSVQRLDAAPVQPVACEGQ